MIQEQDIVKENSETLNSSVMTEAYNNQVQTYDSI